MRIKLLALTMITLLVFGLIFCYSILPQLDSEGMDTVSMNEITKIAEISLKSSDKVHYPKGKYKFDIIKSSEKYYDEKLNNAIKNGDTVVDLYSKGRITGKIIFYTNRRAVHDKLIYKFKVAVAIVFGFLLLIIVGYLVYLRKVLYTPFVRLQKFASSVAAGNLDIPFRMEKENFFGAFTESFDIMREELKKARYNEYLANISKKELVASLSHDVKTPVASIKAVSELVMIISNDEKTKKHLQTIYKKADQIDRLITDMFHSTLEELSQLSVNATEQFSSVLEEIIKTSDYYERVSIGHIPQCLIKVDMLRIRQVFDNVINNSYKYAKTSIDIDFLLTEAYLEVSINDYGKGVKEDELPLLFNKFYRGENSSGENGSGLGLYLSKYFMEKQNGDMSCYNRQDGFTVKLFISVI